MNDINRRGVPPRLGFLAVLLASVVSLKADPIEVGPEPIFDFATIVSITLAILAEAICIQLLLRRWRRPRLFILWLMGMHLLTYPLLLGWLWLFVDAHPAPAVVTGEGLIVLIEGSLIYLMCRLAPSGKSALSLPSVSRALFASLIGNICSAAAYPLILMLFAFVARSIGAPTSD